MQYKTTRITRKGNTSGYRGTRRNQLSLKGLQLFRPGKGGLLQLPHAFEGFSCE